RPPAVRRRLPPSRTARTDQLQRPDAGLRRTCGRGHLRRTPHLQPEPLPADDRPGSSRSVERRKGAVLDRQRAGQRVPVRREARVPGVRAPLGRGMSLEAPTVSEELTAEQAEVTDAPASARLLVTAGPGAGKTHVLIARLAALIDEGVSPGHGILVLS